MQHEICAMIWYKLPALDKLIDLRDELLYSKH